MTPATAELSEESIAQLIELEEQHKRLIEELRTKSMEGELPFELFDQEAELVENQRATGSACTVSTSIRECRLVRYQFAAERPLSAGC